METFTHSFASNHQPPYTPCPASLPHITEQVTAFRIGGTDAADAVSIFSAAGKLQGRGSAEPSRLISMAWSASEHLVAVFENGEGPGGAQMLCAVCVEWVLLR